MMVTSVKKQKKLVIVGDSAFAEVAYECFTHDSIYEVVGFAVEATHHNKKELFGLPVIVLEAAEQHFVPSETEFYAALVYSQLNRLRTRLYRLMKSKGYRPASYISSSAFLWHNVKMGEHCFVFENNTLQPFVEIGDNVVLWSGNHIGHHSVIEDNCFISSQVVISGFCHVGRNTFIGVNAALANNVYVAEDNWVGVGVAIVQDTQPDQLFKSAQVEVAKVSASRFFKVKK